MKLEITHVLKWTQGQAHSIVEKSFSGIGTDTRKNLAGQLFVALKGDDFDAHDFLVQAQIQGASGLLVHRVTPELEAIKNKITIIEVQDTLKALQDLGRGSRLASSAKYLAITGSNGKTTTKEFTAQIISQYKKVHFSEGSFNNHWGVPISILAEPEGTEIVILEMGMNHKNEIAGLMKIATPDITGCTTVGTAHIENFGTVEKIAEAKEEIYEHAKPNAVFVFNRDNPLTKKMSLSYPAHSKIEFSNKDESAQVYLKAEKQGPKKLVLAGSIQGVAGQIEVSVFGKHNEINLAAAAAFALAAGLSPQQIWQGLLNCKTTWGRNQWVSLNSGAEILFDGYNANPDSMKALLENCESIETSGKKVAVLAQMLELGELSSKFHFELGAQAAKANFDRVWFYGPDYEAFKRGFVYNVTDSEKTEKTLLVSDIYKESLASEVAVMLRMHDIVFVKGSRGMKLEKFVMSCDPVNFSVNKKMDKV